MSHRIIKFVSCILLFIASNNLLVKMFNNDCGRTVPHHFSIDHEHKLTSVIFFTIKSAGSETTMVSNLYVLSMHVILFGNLQEFNFVFYILKLINFLVRYNIVWFFFFCQISYWLLNTTLMPLKEMFNSKCLIKCKFYKMVLI